MSRSSMPLLKCRSRPPQMILPIICRYATSNLKGMQSALLRHRMRQQTEGPPVRCMLKRTARLRLALACQLRAILRVHSNQS